MRSLGLNTVTPVDLALGLGVSEDGARNLIRRHPLKIKRGRSLALPACQLGALLARAAPPIETLRHDRLLGSAEAARRLGVSPTYFRKLAPRQLADVRREAAGKFNRHTYLYPAEAIEQLRAARAA